MKHIKLFENQASFDTYRGGGSVDYPVVASVNNSTYILTPPTIYYTTTDGNQISDANTGLSSSYIVSHTKESNGEYKIVLKDTMTSIPNQCFFQQFALKTIRFKNLINVTSIDGTFLLTCSSLQSIDLSGLSQVTSIGEYFLLGCSSLQSVDLSPLSKVTSINYAFLRHCSSLQSVDLSPLSNVTSIGDQLLYACDSLETLTMPNTTSITSIGSYYLSNCSNLTTIYCPKGTLDFYKTLMPDRASIMLEMN